MATTPTQISVQEDRTYKCLKADKSIDLNDLTPQNLNDTSYWTFEKYEVNEFCVVLEDSTESKSPDTTLDPDDIENTALYTKGIYQCTAEDLDIKVAKVTTFTTRPTDWEQVKDCQAPLCFGKYLDVELTDGTTQRVNIALQKWNRVADLPAKPADTN